MSDDVELVVAGAGPAGSVAALLLARAGRRVALVDRAAFPRDKICGDLIGTEAVASLAELGLRDTLADALHLTGAVLYDPSGRATAGRRSAERAPRPSDARVLQRAIFDARVRSAALDAGAIAVRATSAGLVRDGERICGLRTTAGEIRARVVIGAEGWGSPVARALGRERPAGRAVTVRAYATDAAGLDRRMHFFVNRRGDGYAWIFPLASGGANVGLGFICGEPGAGDPHAAFDRFLDGCAPAVELLSGARVELAAAWPIPLGPWTGAVAAPGAFLVGDAAALASPLSGSGIHHALASGAAAARFAQRALDGNGDAPRDYARWLGRHVGARLHVERLAHRALGTPSRAGAITRATRLVPGAATVLSNLLLALG